MTDFDFDRDLFGTAGSWYLGGTDARTEHFAAPPADEAYHVFTPPEWSILPSWAIGWNPTMPVPAEAHDAPPPPHADWVLT